MRQILPHGSAVTLIRTTGHSLGGGLASAASLSSEAQPMPACIFNAAGLHADTITYRDEGVLMQGMGWVDGALEQYEKERVGAGIITAISTKYDPLTLAQEQLIGLPLVNTIPTAIGKQIRLESPFDCVIEIGLPELVRDLRSCPVRGKFEPYDVWSVRFAAWIADIVGSVDVVAKLTPHHGIYAVEWGQMVEITTVPGTRRKFDIFGDPDPGK